MIMEIIKCSECGGENIGPDTEYEDMWRCMDCDNRFPKEREASMDDLDEEMEEDLGLLGEPDEEW